MSRITKIELQQQLNAKVEVILALQREISELRQQLSNFKHATAPAKATPANEQHVVFTALDRKYAYKAYQQLSRKGQRAHYEPMNVKRGNRVVTVFNVVVQ